MKYRTRQTPLDYNQYLRFSFDLTSLEEFFALELGARSGFDKMRLEKNLDSRKTFFTLITQIF